MEEKFELLSRPGKYTLFGVRHPDGLCGYIEAMFPDHDKPVAIAPMEPTEIYILKPPAGWESHTNLDADIAKAFNIIYSMAMIEERDERLDRPTYEAGQYKIIPVGEINAFEPDQPGDLPRRDDHTVFVESANSVDTRKELATFDGRMDHHNNIILEDFWQDDYLENWIKEIDKDAHIGVVHRKGKDWTLYGNAVEMDASAYSDLPGMFDADLDESFWASDLDEHPELVKKILQALESIKHDLEISGYILNQLHYDHYNNDWTWYDLAEDHDLKHYFPEGEWELHNQMLDSWIWENIDWSDYRTQEATLAKEFNRIYQPLLKEAKAEYRKRKADRLVERQHLWKKLKEFVGMKSDTTIIEADFLACF